MSNENSYVLKVGDKIFIRAVTYHYTGLVMWITKTEIGLEQAAWVVNSGNFTEAMTTGKLQDVEPYPDNIECVVINRRAIVDYCTWPHALQRPGNS